MPTKASDWAAEQRRLDEAAEEHDDAGPRFHRENANGDGVSFWVSADGSLGMFRDSEYRGLPQRDAAELIAWLTEWFTEEVTNG